MNRSTDWIQTYTGLRFYSMEPSADDVCIEDIAHALSLMCRFGGHCKQFYSVAQHSVLVSLNCKYPLHGLLHDAEEAYLADICRPVKRSLRQMGVTAIDEANNLLMTAISERFGVEWDECSHGDIKRADDMLLATERRDLMPPMADGSSWTSMDLFVPLEQEIVPVLPPEAERMFLTRYKELTRHVSAYAQEQ